MESLRTLSDHLFELVRNSIDAGAQRIRVTVEEKPAENLFLLIIEDNGKGMDTKTIAKVLDPFYTHRKGRRRRIGLGIPMMAATCERSGGALDIESVVGKGTTITAKLEYNNIDRPPLGDLADLFLSLLSITEHRISWVLEHRIGEKGYTLKSREIFDVCGSPKFAFKNFYDKAKSYIYVKESPVTC